MRKERQHKDRRLPAKWAPVMTAFFLSVFMCGVVSLVATVKALGVSPQLVAAWMEGWAVSWLLAFPVVLIVMPLVRRIVSVVCRPASGSASK